MSFNIDQANHLIAITFGHQQPNEPTSRYRVAYKLIDYNSILFTVYDYNDTGCLEFEYKIRKDGLKIVEVHLIKKCINLSGEEIITKVIQTATNPIFNADIIRLTDASEVFLIPDDESCSFNLYTLKILTTGHSWYNQYGFFSDPFTQDAEIQSNNEAIRNLSLREIFNNLQQITLNTELKYDYEALADDLQNNQEFKLFRQYLDRPLYEVALYMEHILQTPNIDCDNPIIQWIIMFLNIIHSSGIITYYHELTRLTHDPAIYPHLYYPTTTSPTTPPTSPREPRGGNKKSNKNKPNKNKSKKENKPTKNKHKKHKSKKQKENKSKKTKRNKSNM
jgi:hypothetical protein